MSWEPNPLEQRRLEKMELLREAGLNPFPLRAQRTHTAAQALSAFATAEAD